MKAVSESLSKLSLYIELCYAWTDSTIMLRWLAAETNCWSTFVANRVTKIQEIDLLKWSLVGTHDNPADIASGGIDPNENEKSFLAVVRPSMADYRKVSRTVSTARHK